jgi:hypothetical protein
MSASTSSPLVVAEAAEVAEVPNVARAALARSVVLRYNEEKSMVSFRCPTKNLFKNQNCNWLNPVLGHIDWPKMVALKATLDRDTLLR